ncbi:hypothetical protein A2U01_0092696, partial [Trifolium medium]|nr:hypothetical protein [Trifolium medium]
GLDLQQLKHQDDRRKQE